MKKKYIFDFTVRGYELDSFNHVNNAVYLQWIEQARWEILKSEALLDYFLSSSTYLVVIDTHIRYIREARLFDPLSIVTTVREASPYLEFLHAVRNRNDNRLVAKATIKTLFVDENRVPTDIPAAVAEKMMSSISINHEGS